MKIYFIIIPMTILIALIYYGAILLISHKVANRLNIKRAELEAQAQVDSIAKAKWEKSIKRRTKIAEMSFTIIKFSLFFIVAMLIIGSIIEIEQLTNNYKIDEKIFSLKSIKAFTTPLITLLFIYNLIKIVLAKGEKKDI